MFPGLSGNHFSYGTRMQSHLKNGGARSLCTAQWPCRLANIDCTRGWVRPALAKELRSSLQPLSEATLGSCGPERGETVSLKYRPGSAHSTRLHSMPREMVKKHCVT